MNVNAYNLNIARMEHGMSVARQTFPNVVVEGGTPPIPQRLEESRAFITAVRGMGEAMRAAAAEITNQAGALFDSMVGASSNGEAMTVYANGYENGNGNGYENGNGNGNGYENGNGNGYAVRIRQTATAQQNTGYAQQARGANGASRGRNNFTIARNGNSYNFSVNVFEVSSNRALQQRMANEINGQISGVTARVEAYDTGESALVLTAASTGEHNAFTIADVPGQGTAVAATGTDTITREAANAVYSVNGEERTSPDNTIELGEGLRAVLHQATEEMILAAATRDTQGIATAIDTMVESFNVLREAAVEYSRQDNSAYALRRRLDGIIYDTEPDLLEIGITRDIETNTLQIDETELIAAIENGTAEENLTDPMGFAARLARMVIE